jgi:8-oxo-dGTP pyrophosphatase MutT (NUDIX family)
MEVGEKADAAARREVKEETALDPVRLITLEKVNVFYNATLEAIHLEPCFGAEVTGGAEPTMSAEHDACRWCAAEEAERLLPFAGVRAAFRELCGALGAAGEAG